MKEQPWRERLSGRRALLGLLQAYPGALFAEMAPKCGYDFLFLDGEYGKLAEADFAQALQALESTEVLAFVRLAAHDLDALSRFVSMGADAIVVPHVSTAQQATDLVRAMDSAAADRARQCLIVIIESLLGAAHAQEILAVDGVDGVFVGPSDLSADQGRRGDYSHREYADALARIEHAAAVTGKFLGTAPHAGYPLAALLARGHRLFVLGTDVALVHDAMSAQLAQARATCERADS